MFDYPDSTRIDAVHSHRLDQDRRCGIFRQVLWRHAPNLALIHIRRAAYSGQAMPKRIEPSKSRLKSTSLA
jgi:hypothetical protein